jgi:hypothetical protein
VRVKFRGKRLRCSWSMPPDMTTSLESKGMLPPDEGGAEARAKVEWRQLLGRFLLAFGLIAGPIGIATMIAHWAPLIR